MSNRNIDPASKSHENISEKIESTTFNSIHKVLPDKAIEDACNAVGYRYRQRMITPIVTVLHMILAAIWPEESFAATGYHGKCRYPLARLVTLCIAGTMTVLDYALGRYDQDENSLAGPLLGKLQKGDLLLADRHFAAAHFYWYYQVMGVEFLTKAHQRLKISRIKPIESCSPYDFLGWLNINETYRRKDPRLPAKIMVRFIRTVVRDRGQRKTVWLVTSLLDGELYPAKEIALLYGKRWRIETLFREVKINLSADVLRSMCSQAIRKEVAARLMAVNIVRMIMIEAAIEKGVDPTRISFVQAVRAILMFAPALACEPIWKLPQIYKAMLVEIGTNLVPERPGRNEPRAITREPKHYPKLKSTRQQWRKAYAA